MAAVATVTPDGATALATVGATAAASRLLLAAVTALLLGGATAAPLGAAEPPRPYLPPSARGPAGAAAPVQYGDPGRAAALEARNLELEEELRRLTGRIEELEYQQGQLISRLERLESDAEERRRTAEASSPPPAAEQAAAAEEPDEAEQTPPPPPRTVARAEPTRPAAPQPAPGPPRQPAPDVEPDAAAAKGYVLGAIPRGAAGTPAQSRPPPPAPGGETATAARPPAAASNVGYDGALGLLQAGRWAEAEQAFRGFIDKTPEDPRASSAAFWLGETYFFRKDYPNAAATFARNYRTYGPEAQKAPDNLLKLGMSLAAMGDKTKACQTFGELAKRHPTAPAPVRQTLARERTAAACA